MPPGNEKRKGDAQVLGEPGSPGKRTEDCDEQLRKTSRQIGAKTSDSNAMTKHSGASSNRQTIPGSRQEASGEQELCPADAAEGGAKEDPRGVQAEGDDAMEGPDEEESEEARDVRPAQDPRVPNKAEYERHTLTNMSHHAVITGEEELATPTRQGRRRQ